jgi:Zn-finger nucleic acid-binding protein
METRTRDVLCPRDASPLEIRRWGESDYGFCPTCHGIRIEGDQLAEMIRRADEPPLSYPSNLSEGTEIVEGTVLCSCPGQPVMDGLVHGDLSLDVCRACGAMWFDAGEIQCYLAEKRRQAPVSLGDSRSTFEVLLDVMREAAPVAGTGFPIDYVDVFFD